MGRKRTGGKAGRKSDLEAEQIHFLESYGEQFRAGSGISVLYSEVLEKWIDKFGYAGLNPKNKNGIDPLELQVDQDLALVSIEERQRIVNLREEAKLALRTVSHFHIMLTIIGWNIDHSHRKSAIGFVTTITIARKTRTA
jgi:hypothetical protein